MTDLLSLVVEADLFGKPLIFEKNMSQKHNTLIGNIVTKIILITSSLLGFLFGKEIYERKTPTVISTEEIIPTSRITFRDYPVIITFSYFDGTPLKNATSAFSWSTAILKLNDDQTFEPSYITGLQQCNASDYTLPYNKMITTFIKFNEEKGLKGNELFCINPSIVIQNGHTELNSTMANIKFSFCDSNSDNRNMNKCHPDIEKIKQDIFIATVTFDVFIDPNNYTDPIRYYTNIQPHQTSQFFMKRNYVNIEKSKLTTHKGWLFEDIEDIEVLTLKSSTRDVNPTVRDEVFQLSLFSPTRRNTSIRRYMKIQDLLANIGGVFNFLLVASSLLINNYVDFNFYLSYLLELKRDEFNKLISNKRRGALKDNFNFQNLSLNLNDSVKGEKPNYQNILIKEFQVKEVKREELTNKDITNNNSCNLKENDVSNSKNNIELLNNNFIFKKKSEKQASILNSDLSNSDNISQSNDSNRIEFNSGYCDKENELNKINLIFEVKDWLRHHNSEINFPQFENTSFLNYLSYIWNDVICCRRKYLYGFKVIRDLMSFNHLLYISMKNSSELIHSN